MTNEEKWAAVVNCDASYDGIFYYGVKTTGIFCRPSCKSKKPLRSNITFFPTIEAAYDYGLRPCKRCRPDLLSFNPTEEIVKKAKAIFDSYFQDHTRLTTEIKSLGISQNHLIQLFRRQFNETPVGYINRLRVERAKALLRETDMGILNIAMSCGFGSLSSFYECFKKQVALTPKEYQRKYIHKEGVINV